MARSRKLRDNSHNALSPKEVSAAFDSIIEGRMLSREECFARLDDIIAGRTRSPEEVRAALDSMIAGRTRSPEEVRAELSSILAHHLCSPEEVRDALDRAVIRSGHTLSPQQLREALGFIIPRSDRLKGVLDQLPEQPLTPLQDAPASSTSPPLSDRSTLHASHQLLSRHKGVTRVLVGVFCPHGNATWQILSVPDSEHEDGLKLSFPFSRQLRPEQALLTLETRLRDRSITWLRRRGRYWDVDLDSVSTEFPGLLSGAIWAQGTHTIVPDVLDRASRHGTTAETRVQFVLNKEDMQRSSRNRRKVLVVSVPADDTWLRQVRSHLTPLMHEGMIEVWDSDSVAPGADEHEETEVALSTAHIAVVLLSADFLSSKKMVRGALPRLLERAAQKTVRLLTLFARPCLMIESNDLLKYRSINPRDRALSTLSGPEAEAVLVSLAQTIAREHNDT